LGDGRWEYRFYIKGIDGRAKRVSRIIRATNRTAANRQAATIASDAARSGAATNDKRTWTVKRYIAWYFDSYADDTLARNTLRRYRQMADNQVIPAIGHLRMTEITGSDLERLYGRLRRDGGRSDGRKGGLSEQSIFHVHRFIHAVFNHAVKNDVREWSPADRATIKTPDKKRPTLLDADRVEGLLAVFREAQANGSRLYLPVLLAAYTGARRGEVLGLKWSDVDFDGCTITIQRSLQDAPDGASEKGTKTGAVRVVPLLDDQLVGELKAHKAAQREARMALGKAWKGPRRPEDDYICCAPDGSAWQPALFTRTYRRFCIRQGFPEVNYHSLRHAFASMGARLGIDAITMADLLGHSPDVFLTVYAHAFDEAKRDAVQRMTEARKKARKAV
jgi:integrase